MIGLAEPAGALGLVALAVLVALHLLARRQRTVAVSSLRLWRRLPAQSIERRRFLPDLLFLIQAALLLVLALALMRPYLPLAGAPAGGRALVAVVDLSASMQTREPAGSRIDIARGRLRALVDALDPGLEVMLIAAGARPSVALRWTADRGVALGALETLDALDVGTSLAPAVDLALASAAAHAPARVILLTDVTRDRSGIAPGALARIDYVAIGRTDDNVGLTGLRVDAPPFGDPAAAVAVVEVRNASHAARRARLVARIEDRAWTRRAVDLPAHGVVSVALAAPPATGLLTVALEDHDALGADDRALGWVPAATPLDLVVASDDASVVRTLRTLVAAVPRGRVEVVPSAALDATKLQAGATLVLDRIEAPPVDAGPLLAIAPPKGAAPCATVRRHPSAAVVDWDDAHPMLTGLSDLQALELTDVAELSAPAGASDVVLAAAPGATFPLLVAGETNGHRIACLGARLGAPDDLPLLLLVLGTLRWLAEPPGLVPITLPTGTPIPDGGEPAVAERVGATTIDTAAGPRVVIANLFDADESDVGRDEEGEWPATVALPATPGGEGRTDLTWWPILLGTLLAIVEWGVWAFA
ncbi:MAG TPA: VWA domain-containing protein [Candidatus Eisenbacteria bacterium]|nr:VWA domain-containing protein [Candidatus Eisenbacteria bacterium]